MRLVLIAVALLAACATPPPAPVTAAPVIAAERAFAADAAARGWIPAFRTFAAPDSVVLRPDPVNAAQRYAATPDDGDRTLQWWPAYAGVSRGGDLGFTTGPVLHGDDPVVRLHYFTVWRRQPDGAWRWIFDGGVPVTDPAPFSREQLQLPTLPVAVGGAGSAAAAIVEITALEKAHPTSVSLAPLLAETVRAHRPGAPLANGAEAARPLLAGAAVTYEPIKIEAAATGDLAMSLSIARWRDVDGEKKRYAVRLWQWRPEGWRIVYDQIAP